MCSCCNFIDYDLILLNCDHTICLSCLLNILKSNKICPVKNCYQNLLTKKKYELIKNRIDYENQFNYDIIEEERLKRFYSFSEKICLSFFILSGGLVLNLLFIKYYN